MFALILTIICSGPITADQRLAQLETTLNGARQDDPQITLVAGNDFEASHGTVLFLPRAEGARRLIALARMGRDEVSVIFVPSQDAWIVDTCRRGRDSVLSDTRYGVAAAMSYAEVEYWHTHNMLDDDPPVTDQERWEQAITSSVPSYPDLLELYAVRAKCAKPLPGLRGVVAGVLGTVTFWSDDLVSGTFMTFAGLLPQILDSESRLLMAKAKAGSMQDLERIVAQHRGIFWYRYEPFP